MTATRRALAAVLCLAALVACTSDPRGRDRTVAPPVAGSSPDPRGTGPVTVTGELRRADGRPAAGQAVLLSKELKGRDLAGDLLVGTFTGGFALLSCFDPQGAVLSVCRRNGYTSRTLADGRYALQLSDAEARATLGGRRRLTLSAAQATPTGGTGAAVAATTAVGAGVNRLPRLSFWQPAVTGAGGPRVAWTPLPAASAADPSYDVLFTAPTGLRLSRPDVGSPLEVDPRLLEDSRGTVSVQAAARTGGVDVAWTSPGTPYAGTAGAPPSRSRPCTVAVEGAAPRVEPRCWLTDGAFGTGYGGQRPRSCRAQAPPFGDLVECATGVVTSVQVDLGRALPLDLIVLRGDCLSCRAERSLDARTWTPLAERLGGQPLHAGGVEARFVRVVADEALRRPREYTPAEGARPNAVRLAPEAAGDLATLTELSVWPGRPAGADAPGGRSESEERTGWAWVAGALLLLVVAGLGYALGTRRR